MPFCLSYVEQAIDCPTTTSTFACWQTRDRWTSGLIMAFASEVSADTHLCAVKYLCLIIEGELSSSIPLFRSSLTSTSHVLRAG